MSERRARIVRRLEELRQELIDLQAELERDPLPPPPPDQTRPRLRLIRGGAVAATAASAVEYARERPFRTTGVIAIVAALALAFYGSNPDRLPEAGGQPGKTPHEIVLSAPRDAHRLEAPSPSPSATNIGGELVPVSDVTAPPG